MAKKIPSIPLSFKDSPEDTELKEWLMKKSNRSGFIKDVLKERMQEEKVKAEKLKNLYK